MSSPGKSQDRFRREGAFGLIDYRPTLPPCAQIRSGPPIMAKFRSPRPCFAVTSIPDAEDHWMVNLLQRVVYFLILKDGMGGAVWCIAVVHGNVVDTPLCKLCNVILFVPKHSRLNLTVRCGGTAAAVRGTGISVSANFNLPGVQIVNHRLEPVGPSNP